MTGNFGPKSAIFGLSDPQFVVLPHQIPLKSCREALVFGQMMETKKWQNR